MKKTMRERRKELCTERGNYLTSRLEVWAAAPETVSACPLSLRRLEAGKPPRLAILEAAAVFIYKLHLVSSKDLDHGFKHWV